MAGFAHLDVETDRGFGGSTATAERLAEQCRALGMASVGVADRNLLGALAVQDAAKAAGLRAPVGARLALATPWGDGEVKAYPTTPEGRVALCRTLEAPLGLRLSDLAERGRDWVLLSGAGPGAFLPQALGRGAEAEARAWLDGVGQAAPGRLLVEVQRVGVPGERAANRALVRLADAAGLPLVATNPVRYLRDRDHAGHILSVAVRRKAPAAEVAQQLLARGSQHHWLKPPEEMARIFADLPEAVANTLAVVGACRAPFPLSAPRLPTDVGGADPVAALKERVGQGLAARLGAVPANYRERAVHELRVIVGKGFAPYFLIVLDFVEHARREGIAVGPGRGSGAGSLVAWALGITDVDPLEHGLIFERFLNPEREALPDFDIDFDPERRHEVIAYVRERYGADRVASLATVATARTKTAIKDVARALGVPHATAHRLAQASDDEEALARVVERDREARLLIERAASLAGTARQAGTHPAGVVIAPFPVSEVAPVRSDGGLPTLQITGDDAERAGLVKFDFLGLRTLRILQVAKAMLGQVAGVDFDEAFDLEDPAIYELLASGATRTVFQLEEAGMQNLLRQYRPERFADLCAAVAMYRPGPLQSGMVEDAIKRKRGQAATAYPHPALEGVLRDTQGIFLYQEQVMDAARLLAGYSAGEADSLRKAMGKKRPEIMAEERQRFMAGARAAGVLGEADAAAVFDLMANFAGYGFNKSHSVAYAKLSCETAFLKARHPHIHFAAVLSCSAGRNDRLMPALAEARRCGVAILAPDVNASKAGFEPTRDGRIAFGLGAVRNVGKVALGKLLDERAANGPYASLEDLMARTGINRRVAASLNEAGALRGFGEQGAVARAIEGGGGFFDGEARPWTAKERRRAQLGALGVYLDHHPMDLYRSFAKHLRPDAIGAVGRPEGRRQATFIGAVSSVERSRGNGPVACRITLDDGTGAISVEVPDSVAEGCEAALAVDQCVRAEVTVRPDPRNDGLPVARASALAGLAQLRLERTAAIRVDPPAERAAAVRAFLEGAERGPTPLSMGGETWHVLPTQDFCEAIAEAAGGEARVAFSHGEPADGPPAGGPAAASAAATVDQVRQARERLEASERRLREAFEPAA